MPINRRKPFRRNDLRHRLIDATLSLIQEGKINQLTIREIAKKVGVSHNAPYKHFLSKDELLAAVAEEGFQILYDRLDAERLKATSDPLKQLQDIGIAYIQFALDYPSHYQLMFGAYRTTSTQQPADLAEAGGEFLMVLIDRVREGQLEEADLNAKGKAFMVLVKVVIRGQQVGVIRADDPKKIALAAWSLVHGFAMLWMDGQILENTTQSITPFSEAITRFFIEGLKDLPT